MGHQLWLPEVAHVTATASATLGVKTDAVLRTVRPSCFQAESNPPVRAYVVGVAITEHSAAVGALVGPRSMSTRANHPSPWSAPLAGPET
jgi:hypothetical protein